jgi:DNA polymerase-3 subunit beta
MTTTIESKVGLSFTVTRKALAEALTAIAPAVAKKSSLPILHNVLIEASTLGVKLMATNLDLYATYRIPLPETSISTYGACATTYKELTDLVNLMESGLLAFYLADDKLTLEADVLSTPLETIDAGEFPNVPQPKDGIPQTITLPVSQFRQLVERVEKAAAADDSRPVFSSVYMLATTGNLRLATADQFRLHIADTQVEDATAWYRALLIPAVGLSAIIKKLPKQGDITITSSDTEKVMLKCGSLEVTSRLTEGNFPNFEYILPKEQEIMVRAEVEVSTLLKALKIVTPIARDSANITRLHFTEEAIHLKAKRDGMTSPRVVSISDMAVDGEIEYIINCDYLADALAPIAKETATFAFSIPTKAVRITAPGYLALVMSMNVKE